MNSETEVPAAGESASESGVAYDGRDLEALSAMARYHRWIVERFRPYLGGRTVEYGAGIGTFSKLILPHVETLRIVEPSASLLPALARAFAHEPKVEVVGRTLEADIETLPPESVDTFILINVLEHVQDDEAAVRFFHRTLKKDGRLLLFVPALQWLYSPLDRIFGHYRRYHLGPMTALLRDAGFVAVDGRYMDLLGVAPWWLMNTCIGKTEFNPGLMSFYDRFLVPISRAAEGIVAPPLGKNISIVARKS